MWIRFAIFDHPHYSLPVMRRAETLAAVVLALLSAYLMWKSSELPISWIPGEGPGGGAFPFWLGAGMLVCSIWILVRSLLGKSPMADYEGPFMDDHALKFFILVAGSLTVMIGLIHVVGMYVAVPLFLFFYIRFVGGHRFAGAIVIALAAPIIMFFFFEIALTITLPKGVTEPLFYPLYDIFL